MTTGRMAAAVVIASLALGCDGHDGVLPLEGDATPGWAHDAGLPARVAADFMPVAPRPPAAPRGVAPPALPVFEPCPQGWGARSPSEGAPPVCTPPAPESALRCPAGEARWVDEAACLPVGRACPEGSFADDLPASGVLYVDPGAPAGGDGTRAAPLASIGQALAQAGPGTVVALARATFEEAVDVPEGVTLWGACAMGTRIDSTVDGGDPAATVRVRGTDVVLRNLSVTGPRVGMELEAGAAASARALIVQGAAAAGILVGEGATLGAEELVVEDTAANPEGRFGIGIEHLGARLELRRAVLARNHMAALRVLGGTASVEDAALRDTLPIPADDRFGNAVAVGGGARLALERSVVERCHGAGIAAFEDGTAVTVTRSVIRDVREQLADGLLGYAILAEGSEVTLRRTLIADSLVQAVAGDGGTMRLTLEDVLVVGTRSRVADGIGGRGISLTRGAQGTLARVWIADNRDLGVLFGTGSSATVQDLVVRGTRGRALDETGGGAVQVNPDAEVRLERVRLEDNRSVGVLVGGTAALVDVEIAETARPRGAPPGAPTALAALLGGQVTAERLLLAHNVGLGIHVGDGGSGIRVEDLVIRDTQPIEDGLARAVQVERGRFTAVRAMLERNVEAGIVLVGGALHLEDVVIRDNEGNPLRASPDDPRITVAGFGLEAQPGSHVTGARLRFERNTTTGLGAFGPETRVDFNDLVIRDTRVSERSIFGRGLHVQGGGVVTLTRAVLEDNREIALGVFEPGSRLDASEVRITRALARCEEDCGGLPPGGIGAGAYTEASLRMEGFRVEHSALVGVQAARDGSLALVRGVIAGNPIGANVQLDSVDFERLSRDVMYVGNGRNLDTAELPVPGESR